MDKKRIIYIGETNTHTEYLKGNVPSHWFYGACEMEKDGHIVIWCQEKRRLLNDIKLIASNSHDIIFIPNLNFQNHLILLVLSALKLYRKPIYAYLHREPQVKSGFKGIIYKILLSGIRHVFFLSEKSMSQTVNNGLISGCKCSVPNWGPDMDFYSKIDISDGDYFISTGKENRDFEILIEAFRRCGAPLRIFTVANNYSSHYEFLEGKCKDIHNIEVKIVENTSANYPQMVKEMAGAHAIVCPIRKDKINYCVGLSTIADAEGLKKPLIITRNPYHDEDRVSELGVAVTTVDEWIEAIKEIQKKCTTHSSASSMANAYLSMKDIMKL